MTTMNEDWSRLCRALQTFGDTALAAEDELDQREGLRHALRFVGILADAGFEHRDPARPSFRLITNATRKYFGDCPDVDYWNATIDPRYTYRISGTRGTAPNLSAIVYRESAGNRVAGNLADSEIEVAPDGSFELWLSPERLPGAGIVLDEGCAQVVLREYHKQREREIPAMPRIEQVSHPVGPRPPLDPGFTQESLIRVARGLESAPHMLAGLIDRLRQAPNTLRDSEEVRLTEIFFGTTSNRYLIGWFELEPGQALEFTLPPVPTQYTGVQVFNRWFESLEWRDHVTSLNDATWVANADGTATFRIGGDPSAANHLDTCGHRGGIVLVRFLDTAVDTPRVECRVLG